MSLALLASALTLVLQAKPPFPGYGQPLFATTQFKQKPSLERVGNEISKHQAACGMPMIYGQDVDPKIVIPPPQGDFKIRIIEKPDCR